MMTTSANNETNRSNVTEYLWKADQYYNSVSSVVFVTFGGILYSCVVYDSMTVRSPHIELEIALGLVPFEYLLRAAASWAQYKAGQEVLNKKHNVWILGLALTLNAVDLAKNYAFRNTFSSVPRSFAIVQGAASIAEIALDTLQIFGSSIKGWFFAHSRAD